MISYAENISMSWLHYVLKVHLVHAQRSSINKISYLETTLQHILITDNKSYMFHPLAKDLWLFELNHMKLNSVTHMKLNLTVIEVVKTIINVYEYFINPHYSTPRQWRQRWRYIICMYIFAALMNITPYGIYQYLIYSRILNAIAGNITLEVYKEY